MVLNPYRCIYFLEELQHKLDVLVPTTIISSLHWWKLSFVLKMQTKHDVNEKEATIDVASIYRNYNGIIDLRSSSIDRSTLQLMLHLIFLQS